jgi:hypothetical protein
MDHRLLAVRRRLPCCCLALIQTAFRCHHLMLLYAQFLFSTSHTRPCKLSHHIPVTHTRCTRLHHSARITLSLLLLHFRVGMHACAHIHTNIHVCARVSLFMLKCTYMDANMQACIHTHMMHIIRTWNRMLVVVVDFYYHALRLERAGRPRV